MKLKNITFANVWGQSGVQGFFGEGDEYPHHRIYKLILGLFGFSFTGATFVAKTITLNPRIYPESSNTELKDGYKLKKWFPNSIWVDFFGAKVVNAVGLANPGAEYMLKINKWQKRRGMFQISFMPMAGNLVEKLIETENFCKLVHQHMSPEKYKNYAIQINFSCPNTGHNQEQDPGEIIEILKIFRKYFPDTPLIPKFDLLFKQETIVAIKPYCDAFLIGNTLPFGKGNLTGESWWKYYFPNGSPLLKYFGGKFAGGLSGKPLYAHLLNWVDRMEQVDPTVIIIAGGGIMTKRDIDLLSSFHCVKGIALGSVAIVRPWRLQSLIQYGNQIFSQKQNF